MSPSLTPIVYEQVRVPFLDQDFMSYTMNDWMAGWKMISGEDNKGRPRIEKHILRAAFDTPEDPYLPDDILWRQKEQFSDGVRSLPSSRERKNVKVVPSPITS